jgi:proteasome lid subunit RPN8/RPN11
MVAPKPARLQAGRQCLIVLERVLRAAEPQEGCALLLGYQQGESLVLQRIWPCCNRWEPAAERERRFQLDPREQLLAQRWGRDHGLQVIGSAHSHPSSHASPSGTDRLMTLGPTLMLIRTGLPAAASSESSRANAATAGLLAPLQAWWLLEPDAEGLAPIQPLELKLLPEQAAA